MKQSLRDRGIDILDFKKTSKVDELMCKKLFGDMKDSLFPKYIDLNGSFPFLWGQESYIIAFLEKNGQRRMALVPLARLNPYVSFEIDGRQKIVMTSRR